MFPSPVGVRPLTLSAAVTRFSIFVDVSVPCWGKAINTSRKLRHYRYRISVSVPCWGKAINTGRLPHKVVPYVLMFPSPVGVRPLTRSLLYCF